MTASAAATGIGSWPGDSPRAAAEVIVGELHQLPYLPELPARGVGADLIGRAAALLVDIALDTVPRGYRIVARPGAVTRRAASLLGEDLDALEEAWERVGGERPAVKVSGPGPITLAAQLELPGGHRAITDLGALRDLSASLAEGMAAHRAHVEQRLGAAVVTQFDEPLLPVALAGRLNGVTALTPVHPVDESRAVELLDACATTVGGEVVLHCCAADVPWKMLQRSTIGTVSCDPTLLDDAGRDGLGEFIDSGRTVILGLVPSRPPAPVTAEDLAAAAAEITDRLGFPRSVLQQRIGLSTGCGLAGEAEAFARAATTLTQRAADAL